MDQTYKLRRRIAERGTFRTVYDFRLVSADDRTVCTGQVRSGYLEKEITLLDEVGAPFGKFGPNRRIAPNRQILRAADGSLIAELRHGMVQSTWGGSGSAIVGPDGDEIASLTPGETVRETLGSKIEAWGADQLVLVRDGEIIGYTGRETPSITATGVVSNVARLALELPKALAKSFSHEVLGKKVDWPEVTAAQLTLFGDGHELDARLVLAILLFKLHYHDLRST